MKDRGEINIAVANYFDNNFHDFSILNRRDGNNVQSKDELRHIIIGRWYYGLYLLAKEKLGKQYISHTGYFDKNNKRKLGIWETLDDNAKIKGLSYDFEKNGTLLFDMRNRYEYNGINVPDTMFQKAQTIYEDMYNELQNI
ncbi:hypothetical protein Bint_2419 [Brachyspira intermedia PWS/A]|uniref:Uncharacterized protein n=1 Tax=Brachyspira intermedia (strain ATCC 51140 / PWS/A) TaxID=1045858 RepID=G0EMY2_BRAIP|nr:hypothetical protein [Brachyspira intermedia]AEM23023.1 hypothetical protein Bint_2419 [Brachyspira intermedia PWS/A]